MACGNSLTSYDSDMTYTLTRPSGETPSAPPTQPPINPPYKQYMEIRKGGQEKPAPPQGSSFKNTFETNGKP